MARAWQGGFQEVGSSFPSVGATSLPWLEFPLAPHRYTAASVIDTASKYKLLWKLPLEDADIIKGGPD